MEEISRGGKIRNREQKGLSTLAIINAECTLKSPGELKQYESLHSISAQLNQNSWEWNLGTSAP